MFPSIQIFTFGTLQVVRGDHLVTESDWHTRQARQLLKILITERPRPVSTDRLIEILWPNSTPQAAATTLRSAVNALRNVLEPDRPNRAPSRYIVTQAPGYSFRLGDEIWLDVEQFERELAQANRQPNPALRRQHLEAALALYKGDYLLSDPYADWAQNERQRLLELYFQALLDLAELQAQSGDYPAAIAACRQILARENVRENAYQALMRYQAASGDSAGALLTYEWCRALLAEELGADPNPLTQSLHQRILNGELGTSLPAAVAPTPARFIPAEVESAQAELYLPQYVHMPALDSRLPTVFVGRERETSLLQEYLHSLQAGQGILAMLEGESGVGKTRLALSALQQAVELGATVLSVTCQALEQPLPFAPIADALSRYLRSLPDTYLHQLPAATLAHLAQIVPSLQDRLIDVPAPSQENAQPPFQRNAITRGEIIPTTSVQGGLRQGAEENRQRLIDAIIAFLTTLAQARPLLFFFDDLHWADADTLAVLGRLAQHLTDAPILVLLAYRTDDLRENEALATLRHALKRNSRAQVINVSRLTQSHVRQIVRLLTGQKDAARIEELAQLLYQATQGNALFLTEAVRDLIERQDHAHQECNHLSNEPGSVPAVRLSLHRNQRVQEVIQERMDRLPGDAQAVLQIAAAIGRDFSLELLEAVAEDDPIEGLQELLERKFLVERSDERLDFSHQVVRQVAYDRLNTLQKRRLHMRIANALRALGRAEENPSETAFHLRLSGPNAYSDFACYSVLAGEKLLRTYGFRQAIRHFDDALALLENQPDAPPELLRRAYQGRGLAYESLLDPDGVADAYWRLQKWAADQGDQELRLAAHGRLTSMLALLGQQRESNRRMEELFSASSGTGNATGSHVITDLLARRRIIYSDETNDELEASRIPWDTPYTVPPPAVPSPAEDLLRNLEPAYAVLPLFDYGWTLRVQGQLPEATACLEAVVELARQTAQPSIAGKAYHQLAGIALLHGDFARSHELNEKSILIHHEVTGVEAELYSLWPRIASAFVSLRASHLDEAERRLQRVLRVLEGRNAFDTYRTSARIGLGWVALERGHLDDARLILEQAIAGSANLYPYTHVRALLGLARVAHLQASPTTSATYLRRALCFAGKRSLLEEYVETVLEITTLQPDGAPLERLLHSTLSYVESLGLNTLAAALRNAAHIDQKEIERPGS